ncbi:MAG: hypothetical protein V3576_02020 [Candidatus Cloacimonadota bacterium]
MNIKYLLLFLLFLSCLVLRANSLDQIRGGIEFDFANPALEEISGQNWFQVDILARSTGASQGMGSGLLLVNYNSSAFGINAFSTGNAAVIPGELLTTGVFPFYNLICADHSSRRLAITYEYMFMGGYGNVLTPQYHVLATIRLRVLNALGNSGLSFENALMQDNQFLDDNFNLFAPVLTGSPLLFPLSNTPQNLCLYAQGDILRLTWDHIPYCTYNVYSTQNPNVESWQLIASNLSNNYWELPSAERGFFRVTAHYPDTTILQGGSRCD